MNAVKLKRSFEVSQTWIKKRCQPILSTQHNILRPRIGMRRTVTENNRTILNISTEKKVTNYFKLVIGRRNRYFSVEFNWDKNLLVEISFIFHQNKIMKMFVSGATLICQLLKLVSAILSLVTLRSPLKLNRNHILTVTVLEYLILISTELALILHSLLSFSFKTFPIISTFFRILCFGRIFSFLLGVWTSGLLCFIHYVTCYFVFSKYTANSISPG